MTNSYGNYNSDSSSAGDETQVVIGDISLPGGDGDRPGLPDRPTNDDRPSLPGGGDVLEDLIRDKVLEWLDDNYPDYDPGNLRDGAIKDIIKEKIKEYLLENLTPEQIQQIDQLIDAIKDKVDEIKDTIKQEIVDRINDWFENYPEEEKGKLFKIVECHGGIPQLDENVAVYDPANTRDKDVCQFPNCDTDIKDPDQLVFMYRGGWNYEDATRGLETGYTSGQVRVIRAGRVGMPRDYDNEVNNPYRYPHLPPRSTKMITKEPKKMMWIHPFLERAVENMDGEPTKPIAFTKFRTNDWWQSGPLKNGPENFEISNGAGFQTMVGGKFSNIGKNFPARLKYSTTSTDGKWIAIYGNSRGKEIMGYPDEPTEGLEYGCVGMSGWMTSNYNTSAGTITNTGLKFAYTMYRIDTSILEIIANIMKLAELAEGIDDEDSYSVPQGAPSTRAGLLSTLDTANYTDKWNKKDKAILDDLLRKYDIKANWYKDQNNSAGNDIRKMLKSGAFDRLKRTTLTDDPATHLALNVVFDMANHYMNLEKGITKEVDHTGLIDNQYFSRRIESGESLTLFDFWNHLMTRVSLGDNLTYCVIDEDIDFEQYARHLEGLAPENNQPELLEFILDMKEKENFEKFRYVKGEIAAILDNGFEITLTHWKGAFLGWCDACDAFGGEIRAVTKFRYVCAGFYEDEVDPTIIEYPIYDTYEVEPGEGFEGIDHFYQTPTTFSPKPNDLPGGVDPLPEERPGPEKGEMGEFQLDPEPRPKTKAQFWRGFHAIPTKAAGAQPVWSKWTETEDPATGQPNMIYTYGPFKKKEMDLYYRFITPKGGSTNDPRDDYGLTWWFANKPDGPYTQGPTQVPGDSPACIDKGYTIKRPSSVVLRGKDPDTGESLTGKPAKYFRVTFWQWGPAKGGVKGPKVSQSDFPPGYTEGGTTYKGKRPRGRWFDSIVTPSTSDNLFEEYYDDPTQGPVYHTLELENTLELHDYQHPFWTMNYMNLGKAGYYKIWGKLSTEMKSDELKARDEPELMGIYTAQTDQALDIKEEPLGTRWKDHWKLVSVIQKPGESEHVIIHLNTGQNVLFTARDRKRLPERDGEVPGDKMNRDWQPAGEPWVLSQVVNSNTINKYKNGPGYWGELHQNRPRPNFHDSRWQVKLHAYHPDAYEHTPNNKTVFPGKRIELKTNKDPSQGGKHRTAYTYDVYFAQDEKFMNKIVNAEETNAWPETGKTHFIYVGTLDYDDDTPFTITCPGDKMIFAARNTRGRSKDTWWNDGEQVQLIVRETTTPRDSRKGPAYWAFGDFGNVNDIRKGFRGYPDFNNAYWNNPLNDAGSITGIPVTKGKLYKLTPGTDMKYTYRIIWGDSEQSKSPLLFEDPNFSRTDIKNDVNTTWYKYEDDENLLRPIFSNNTGSIVVEAQGDQLYFGAFRYDNSDDGVGVDRPALYEWSRFGEPVDVVIEEEITIEGCSFHASEGLHTNNAQADLSVYRRPLKDLVTEIKDIAVERGEDMDDLMNDIMIAEDQDGNDTRWVRTFEINQGRSYLFKRTDDTPAYDYTVRFLKDREQLGAENPIDVTTDAQKNFVWRSNPLEPKDHVTMRAAASDVIIFNAFSTNRQQDDWSRKGEPVFMEVYEQIEEGVIFGKQYWTDWDKPDAQVPISYSAETANQQLKNTHWTNPLKEVDELEEVFEPGKQYKVWVDSDPNALGDGKPCPNYMHVFFAEKYPNAINTGMTKDYEILGVLGNQRIPIEDRYSSTADFNGEENACIFIVPEDKDYIVMGAWQTNNRRNVGFNGSAPGGLKGWNKDGEDIKIRYQEIPIEPLRGPVLWGDHVDQKKANQIMGNKDITEYFALPDGGRGVAPELPVNNNTNPRYYEDLHSMGDNGTEIKPRLGARYRFTPNDDVESWVPPSIDRPYDVRWWFMKDASSLDPARVQQRDYIAGRGLVYPYNHVDVIIDERFMQFGAFDTNAIPPTEWSVEGQPLNHEITFLPEKILNGPAYFSDKDGEFPLVTDPHFYKPLRYDRVVEEGVYAINPAANFAAAGGGKVTVWFVMDDYRNSWRFVDQVRTQNNKTKWPPIPIEGLHPEDLLCYDEIRNDWYVPPQLLEEFYEKGPTIDLSKPGDEAPVIKVPKGCARIIYGWYNQTGRTKLNWNEDGEKVPWDLEQKEYGEIEGPLYWGDHPSKHPEFSNPHFEEELRFVRVPSNKYYVFEPINVTSLDNYHEIDIYEFNPNERNVLNPALNNINQFKLIGTVVKGGGATQPIQVNENGLIFSARKIQTSYNKKKATDWSPKGEPAPLKINEATIENGPVYYAESDKSWNVGGGQPDLSNLKWRQDPLDAYKVPSNECEIYTTKDIVDADYDVYYATAAADLKPGATQSKTRWIYFGTFVKGTKKSDDEASILVPMEAKYVVVGYHKQKPGENRTFDNWSDWGEEGFFKFRARRWGVGPGYPSYVKLNGNFKFDLKELRWEKPMKSNLKPSRNRGAEKFIITSKYDFKKTAAGNTIAPNHRNFQLMWSKTKKPTLESEVTYGRKISTGDKKDKEWTQHPPTGGDYLYFTEYKSTNQPYGPKEMLDFSPTGTAVPWKVKRAKKEWHVPAWLQILLNVLMAILAALIAILAFFAAMAPLDVLMEMVEEGPNNKYPIKRKTIFYHKNDNDEDVPGYNYPDIQYINDDETFYTGLDNEPRWINYTGDVAVRVWARIMKLRHNGFMFHCTNAKATKTGGKINNDHWMEFQNLTPTYGFNFTRLNSKRLKKAFRHYHRNDKTPSDQIAVFNPYDGTGCRVIKPDCRPDPVAQAPKWDKRLVWFKPAFCYSPQLKSSGNWYPVGQEFSGSAKYKLDSNYSDGGGHQAFPCVTSPFHQIDNIFNDLGAGFTVNKYYSSDSGTHAHAFKVLVGDLDLEWPDLEPGRGPFHPGLDFDLKFPDKTSNADAEANWQILRIDTNWVFYDPFQEPEKVVLNKFSRSLTPYVDEEGDFLYQFRKTFDKNPSYSTYKQCSKSRPVVNIKCKSADTVDDVCRLESITFVMWIAGDNKGVDRTMLISNLKSTTDYN